MKKNELLEIAEKIKSTEDLLENEERLVGAVRAVVVSQLGHNSSEKKQDLINKCVNSFAATLREEIGLMDSESCKLLERVRLVTEATVKRDKNRK